MLDEDILIWLLIHVNINRKAPYLKSTEIQNNTLGTIQNY